jgi:glycosyltransferase involved in cell wall biosynthesis
MRRAETDQASFLLLHGPVDVSDEALFVMRQSLERDPLFGWAVPRVRCEAGCCFRSLSESGLATGVWVPRRSLPETPEVEISPELVQPGVLIAPSVVGEFGSLDARFASLAAAVLQYLSRARRCGYRTVIANRAMISIPGLSCTNGTRSAAAVVPESDRALLRQLTPDLGRGWEEFRARSRERFEMLSGHAHRAASAVERPSLLLDIRNVVAVHNGTTEAVLGCVRALRRSSPSWDVSVLANPAAVPFHGLAGLCRDWDVITSRPTTTFTAALRLSQPWHIQEMIDLHQAALFNVYFMLDTIAWDVVYAAPRGLDGTWNFLADHADGYLFDSAFTQRRFLERFQQAASAPRAVCHYPFDPAEYVRAAAGRAATKYALVFGNDLDHKDVAHTVELLTGAFPYQPIVCFGPHVAGTPHVRVCRSGSLPEKEVHGLYANAGLVILPSFYEGFGFPIVTALAYGKTVIARRSDLLSEIARHCSTGRLIAFTRRDELVDIVGRLLHGRPVQEETLGAGLTGRPRAWPDVARDIMRFLEALVRQPSTSKWRQREHAINQLLAFRT